MKQRNNLSKFYCVLALIAVSLASAMTAFACDYDGDDIDDPTAVQTQEDGSFNWKALLSAGGEKTLNGFGSSAGFTMPGHWFGESNAATFGHIDQFFFWTVENGDRLNFGRTNISYYPNREFNGDGIPDTLKFENRCNKIKRSCFKSRARGNFAFNNSDGMNTFVIPVTTATGLFGGGLDPIVIADADGDNRDDVCFARPRKNNPKVFFLKCLDVNKVKTRTQKLSRLYNPPVSARNGSAPDLIVIYQAKKKAGETRFTAYPAEGDPVKFTIPVIGKTIIGDWNGDGVDEVGIAAAGVITHIAPLTGAMGSLAAPEGDVIDCRNNFQGPGEKRTLNSKTSCKIFDCSK